MVAAAAIVLLAGCGGDDGRILRASVRIPVPPAVETLAMDSAGRIWLGEAGGVWVRDTSSAARRRPVPDISPPRVIGWSDAGAYLRAGDSLFVLSRSGDSISARRGELGRNPTKPDVRGRAVYEGARSGAVLAYDPASLEPIWAWAALDAPTTSLALSQSGDRLYQALGRESDPRLLIRDIQTGRVLGRADVAAPLSRLIVGPSGLLYGAAAEDRRAVVMALEPRLGELRVIWQRSLPRDEGAQEVDIAVSEEWVAVSGLGSETGMRVLRAEDGSPLGRTRDEPLDAVFSSDGALWALYPGELRRLE